VQRSTSSYTMIGVPQDWPQNRALRNATLDGPPFFPFAAGVAHLPVVEVRADQPNEVYSLYIVYLYLRAYTSIGRHTKLGPPRIHWGWDTPNHRTRCSCTLLPRVAKPGRGFRSPQVRWGSFPKPYRFPGRFRSSWYAAHPPATPKTRGGGLPRSENGRLASVLAINHCHHEFIPELWTSRGVASPSGPTLDRPWYQLMSLVGPPCVCTATSLLARRPVSRPVNSQDGTSRKRGPAILLYPGIYP
jgi:hypothetical protein